MFRALLELVVTIILAMAARAILGSLFRGFSNIPRNSYHSGQADPSSQPNSSRRPSPPEKVAGELHKDPVCGTYVAESTPFQRRGGRDTFYYCSEECKDKHAMAARG